MEKNRQKIILFLIVLMIIGISFIAVSLRLYGSFIDAHYPQGSLKEGVIFAEQKKGSLKELSEIARDLSDGGEGILLSSKNHKTSFDFSSDTFAKLSIEGMEGSLVVGRGSGNAADDICSHIRSFYSFIGKVDPAYKEKRTQEGMLDGFYARYSAGFLSTGNFFKKEGFYVACYELLTGEDEYLFICFATSDVKDLSKGRDVMRDFLQIGMSETIVRESAGEEVKDGKAEPLSYANSIAKESAYSSAVKNEEQAGAYEEISVSISSVSENDGP